MSWDESVQDCASSSSLGSVGKTRVGGRRRKGQERLWEGWCVSGHHGLHSSRLGVCWACSRLAKNSRILLANSYTSYQSMKRSLGGRMTRLEGPIGPVTPIDHDGPDCRGFEHVQMVSERRSVREGRSPARRAMAGCAGTVLVWSPMEMIIMGENSLQPSGAWQGMPPSSHDALLASFSLVPWRVWEPAPRNARPGGRARLASEPRDQPLHIDGRRDCDMLSVGLVYAPRPRAAQAKGAPPCARVPSSPARRL